MAGRWDTISQGASSVSPVGPSHRPPLQRAQRASAAPSVSAAGVTPERTPSRKIPIVLPYRVVVSPCSAAPFHFESPHPVAIHLQPPARQGINIAEGAHATSIDEFPSMLEDSEIGTEESNAAAVAEFLDLSQGEFEPGISCMSAEAAYSRSPAALHRSLRDSAKSRLSVVLEQPATSASSPASPSVSPDAEDFDRSVETKADAGERRLHRTLRRILSGGRTCRRKQAVATESTFRSNAAAEDELDATCRACLAALPTAAWWEGVSLMEDFESVDLARSACSRQTRQASPGISSPAELDSSGEARTRRRPAASSRVSGFLSADDSCSRAGERHPLETTMAATAETSLALEADTIQLSNALELTDAPTPTQPVAAGNLAVEPAFTTQPNPLEVASGATGRSEISSSTSPAGAIRPSGQTDTPAEAPTPPEQASSVGCTPPGAVGYVTAPTPEGEPSVPVAKRLLFPVSPARRPNAPTPVESARAAGRGVPSHTVEPTSSSPAQSSMGVPLPMAEAPAARSLCPRQLRFAEDETDAEQPPLDVPHAADLNNAGAAYGGSTTHGVPGGLDLGPHPWAKEAAAAARSGVVGAAAAPLRAAHCLSGYSPAPAGDGLFWQPAVGAVGGGRGATNAADACTTADLSTECGIGMGPEAAAARECRNRQMEEAIDRDIRSLRSVTTVLGDAEVLGDEICGLRRVNEGGDDFAATAIPASCFGPPLRPEAEEASLPRDAAPSPSVQKSPAGVARSPSAPVGGGGSGGQPSAGPTRIAANASPHRERCVTSSPPQAGRSKAQPPSPSRASRSPARTDVGVAGGNVSAGRAWAPPCASEVRRPVVVPAAGLSVSVTRRRVDAAAPAEESVHNGGGATEGGARRVDGAAAAAGGGGQRRRPLPSRPMTTATVPSADANQASGGAGRGRGVGGGCAGPGTAALGGGGGSVGNGSAGGGGQGGMLTNKVDLLSSMRLARRAPPAFGPAGRQAPTAAAAPTAVAATPEGGSGSGPASPLRTEGADAKAAAAPTGSGGAVVRGGRVKNPMVVCRPGAVAQTASALRPPCRPPPPSATAAVPNADGPPPPAADGGQSAGAPGR